MKKLNPLLAGVVGVLCSPDGDAAQAAADTKAKRERQFGRVYDHDAGTVTITAAFDSGFSHVVNLSDIPESVIRSFALQSIADYVVNEANDALKDDDNGDETQRREAAKAALADATEECKVEGKLDFRSGVGLGGMRTTIGLVGQALFALGKTYVMDHKGNKLEFTDLHGARNAMRTLYTATEPKGPFTPMVDAQGAPVLDKEGKQRMKAVNPDSNLTGRMLFNAIQNIPEVRAKMEELKPKKSKQGPIVELG